MTSKEKALQLVNKFDTEARGIDKYKYALNSEILHTAKECALIAVDEVIGYGYKPEFPYKYWEEVKKEIESL
jgi:hypothetical protein